MHNSDRSNFHSFYFRMQNAHTKYTKISTIRKFPAIWYMVLLGQYPLCNNIAHNKIMHAATTLPFVLEG